MQSRAELQLLQAELDGARKAEQGAKGDRDKYEVKYRAYKAASKQQREEMQSLQQEVKEAKASAANAWAVAAQAKKQGAGNWADAVSDSDAEDVDDQGPAETAAGVAEPSSSAA